MGLLGGHLGPSWADLLGFPKMLQKVSKVRSKIDPGNDTKHDIFGSQNGAQRGPTIVSFGESWPRWTQQSSAWPPEGSKKAPRRVCLVLDGSKKVPRGLQVASRWAHMAFRELKMAPRRLQDGFNMAPRLDASTRLQEGPKKRPDGLQRASNGPGKLRVAHCSKFGS